jgi:hypothetical protein
LQALLEEYLDSIELHHHISMMFVQWDAVRSRLLALVRRK